MKIFRSSGVSGRIHFSLRSQILLLGMTGVTVIGAIYLVSLQIEAQSQHKADAFSALALQTAKVSEGLVQGREIATEFLQKPDDKKIAAHTETVKAATGYLGDIGMPLPWAAGDFAGWFEAYLGGHWYTFDARNNIPRIGRVLIAQGRDAADVPITQTFGPNTLVSFRVWTDEIAEG